MNPTKLTLSVLLVLAGLRAVPAAAGPEIQAVRSDRSGFEFVYQAPALTLSPDTVEGRVFLRPQISGAVTFGQPGEPALPVRTLLVGVPFGARVEVDVSYAGAVRQLSGVPSPQPTLLSAGKATDLSGPVSRTEASPRAYARVAYQPATAGRLTGVFVFRHQRVARIELYPVQAAPGLGLMRSSEALRVRVSWTVGSAEASAPEPDAFEPLYRGSILNYEVAKGFREPARARIDNPVSGRDFFSASDGPWIRMRLSARGIYEVGYADLQGLNLTAGEIAAVDPTTVRVFTSLTGGVPLDENQDCDTCFMREVECDVRDAQDAPISSPRGFQVGDKVVFYATATQGFPEEYAADTTATDSTTEFLRNEFTDENVYWLTWGSSRFPAAPRRMARVASLDQAAVTVLHATAPARRHFEQDVDYDPDLYDLSEPPTRWEKWWWEEYTNARGNAQGFNLPASPFTLPGAASGLPAQVTLRFWGSERAGNYHNLTVGDANGPSVIGTATWYNRTRHDVVAQFAARPTGNLFTLKMTTTPPPRVGFADPPGTDDQVNLAFFDVLYRRQLSAISGELFFRAPDSTGANGYQLDGFSAAREVYAVRNFGSVQRITAGTAGFFGHSPGGRVAYEVVEPGARRHPTKLEKAPYLGTAWSGGAYLKDVTRGADDVIVSYDPFLSYARELGTWRASHLQGFSAPRVVTTGVQQVYDEFSGGRFDPTAVRNFTRYAYRHWSGSAPAYLTLLGDCSNDFKDNGKKSPAGDGITNFVPMYENAYDDIYQVQFGSDDWYTEFTGDGYPSLAVGRLPAASLEDARLLVRDKTLAYEQNPELGLWRARALLGADDNKLCDAVDPIGYQHTQQTEEMARYFYPLWMDMDRVYLLEYPSGGSGVLCNKTDAERDYVAGMNEGALVVNFVGHGNPQQLANEKLFAGSDVGSIQNRRRLWWFLIASCTVGKVDSYQEDGLAESVMKLRGGGAVVAMAATQLAVSNYSVPMEDSILVHMFNPPAGQTGQSVGLAVVAGKLGFSATTNNAKYVLQGDPALILAVPPYDVRFDAFPDTVAQGQQVSLPFTVYRNRTGTEVATEFSGTDSVEVAEPPIVRKIDPLSAYSYSPGLPMDYWLPSGTIFRGVGTIHNGRGAVSFWMPASARRGRAARVRVYGLGSVAGSPADAAGADTFAVIPGTAADDDSGPTLTAVLQGDPKDVKAGTVVRITAASPHGIYLGTKALNSLYVAVDPDQAGSRRVILNDRFTYKLDSSTEGSVDYPLPALEPGAHTLVVSASSNLAAAIETGQHRKTVTLSFAVAGGASAEVRNVFNYPNPVRTASSSDLYFEYAEAGDATVTLLTVSGRKLRTLRAPMVAGRNRITWDLRDEEGDLVANGTYLFQVEAHGASGQGSKAIGKIVVLRN